MLFRSRRRRGRGGGRGRSVAGRRRSEGPGLRLGYHGISDDSQGRKDSSFIEYFKGSIESDGRFKRILSWRVTPVEIYSLDPVEPLVPLASWSVLAEMGTTCSFCPTHSGVGHLRGGYGWTAQPIGLGERLFILGQLSFFSWQNRDWHTLLRPGLEIGMHFPWRKFIFLARTNLIFHDQTLFKTWTMNLSYSLDKNWALHFIGAIQDTLAKTTQEARLNIEHFF